jgi:hypothetical protein
MNKNSQRDRYCKSTKTLILSKNLYIDRKKVVCNDITVPHFYLNIRHFWVLRPVMEDFKPYGPGLLGLNLKVF